MNTATRRKYIFPQQIRAVQISFAHWPRLVSVSLCDPKFPRLIVITLCHYVSPTTIFCGHPIMRRQNKTKMKKKIHLLYTINREYRCAERVHYSSQSDAPCSFFRLSAAEPWTHNVGFIGFWRAGPQCNVLCMSEWHVGSRFPTVDNMISRFPANRWTMVSESVLILLRLNAYNYYYLLNGLMTLVVQKILLCYN